MWFGRFLPFIFLVSPSIFAAPTIKETQKTYKIYGDSAEQLRAKMDILGPLDKGTHFDAVTNWHVMWQYYFEVNDVSCRLSNIQVSVNVSYQLPEWINYKESNSVLKKTWDRYQINLAIHEQGHADNGKNAAIEIEKILNTLPAMPSCNLLETVAHEKVSQIIAHYDNRDNDYDYETQHGATQGAVFP